MYIINHWEIIERENNKKSAIITTIICLLLLLSFFFLSLGWPPKDMPLSGIMIDFGKTETGQGDSHSDPTKSAIAPTEEVEVEEEQQPLETPKIKTPLPDKVVTQKVEDAINITPKVPKKPQKEIEAEKKVADAKKKADAITAAKAAKAAADAKAKAEADALQAELNNGWGKGGGNGEDNTPGNHGDPNGVNNGGDGLGTNGDGDGVWGLGNRKWLKKPTIINDSQNFGKVTLRIKVDRNGKILSAEFSNYKSTTTNSYLITLAKKEVMQQMKITSDSKAPSEQWGYVTINFKAQ